MLTSGDFPTLAQLPRMASQGVAHCRPQLSDAQGTLQLRCGAGQRPIVGCRVICDAEAFLLFGPGWEDTGTIQVEGNSASSIYMRYPVERGEGGRLASLQNWGIRLS